MDQPETAQPVIDRPKRRVFRKAGAPRPEPALVARQSQAALAAFRAFGNADAARSFLNSAHEGLGGRPIDIAGGSAEGLLQVEAAMQRSVVG